MARQRFIWPDIWKDPVFGRLTAEEKVFFIACFSLADDEGRLLADAASLRGDMFRFNDYSLNRVAKVRDGVVAKVESVHLYVAQGQEYIALLKWADYQKPKYPSPSKIPPPFLQDSPSVPGIPEEDSPMGWVGLGRVGKVRAGLGEPAENSHSLDRLLGALKDADEETPATIRRLVIRHGLCDGDLEWARECATGPGVDSPTRVAVAELRKRGEAKVA